MKYAKHQSDVKISISLLNKGVQKGESVRARLAAFRKSAVVTEAESDFGTVDMNETVKSKSDFVFHTIADTTVIERFKLIISDKNNKLWSEYFEIPVYSKNLPEFKDFQIADGRKVIVADQGNGADTIVLGTGNGDGMANPGESIAILIKDGDMLRRTELLVPDALLNVHGENKRLSDYWGNYDHVGSSAKYSLPLISSSCPENHVINAVVEYWMPDYPNHIIKQGVVNINVSGKDNTPPSIEWIRVEGDNTIMVKVIDGSAVSLVRTKLTLKKDTSVSFMADLRNDGTNGDRQKDDNIFSYRIPYRRFGMYTAEVFATDSHGNKVEMNSPEIFVVH